MPYPYQPYTPNWQGQLAAGMQQSMMPQAPTIQPYQQPVNGVIKVNGRESALQYQLPPNSTSPALFDQSGTCFYIVTTDGTGMKTVECFDFTPHVEQQPVQIDGAQFVSRQEFEDFTAKVNAALGALNGVHEPVPATVPAAGTAGGAEGAHVAAQVNDAGRPVTGAL